MFTMRSFWNSEVLAKQYFPAYLKLAVIAPVYILVYYLKFQNANKFSKDALKLIHGYMSDRWQRTKISESFIS